MKVAAIVVTYNDDYKINEWVEHHQLYKDELFLHIIVDNGSKPEYLKIVEQYFPKSLIIKRSNNGGCTGAYNDGIRLALSNQDIDAIMLIGNDVKIESGGITKLYDFLNSDSQYGMVAPILLSKDSELIDDFGCEISKMLIMKPYDVGKNISEVKIRKRVVASVTGGMNMSTRAFYEKIGLQDEKLFMYSDEVDMAIRAKKVGFIMAVTSEVKSWHQHINSGNKQLRYNYAPFLGSRNKVYLAKKHFGIIRGILQFFYFVALFLALSFRSLFAPSKVKYYFFSPLGAFYGLINNMKIPKGLLN